MMCFKNRMWLMILAILLIPTLAIAKAPKKISLQFENTDILTVLKAFSQKANLNVIPVGNIQGQISAYITNLEPMEALKRLLNAYHYTYIKNGNTIYINSNSIENGMILRSFKIKYIKAKDIKDLINDILRGKNERLSISTKLNTITIQASAEKMRIISNILKEADVPPLQVLVEAKILEIKTGTGKNNDYSKIGGEWKITDPNNANSYVQLSNTESKSEQSTPLGLYAQILKNDISLYLSALEKSIGYDLIATPWLTAINHEEAEILIGSKYGYKTSIISETSTVEEVNFLEVGTKLRFIPHINKEGYIRMDIYPSVSEGSVIDGLPQENTTETRNQVLIKDGKSIVIGGLTKNYNNVVESGIPIISNIPFLGNLFKTKQIQTEKRDIMIIITLNIITPELMDKFNNKAINMEEKQIEQERKASLLK
jgi:type IV pilus assembly protein PilQ